MAAYQTIIRKALKDGGLLDALLALQKEESYVSENALTALAEHIGVTPAELYDTASFYSMLRFSPAAPVQIRVCRGTSCHTGGNSALMEALEKAVSEDPERYDLGWVECLGQCQDSPALLINGQLYTNVDPEKIPELLKEVQA